MKQRQGVFSGDQWVWKRGGASSPIELANLVQIFAEDGSAQQKKDPHDPERVKYGAIVTLRSQTKSKSPGRFLRAEKPPTWRGHAQNLEQQHKFRIRYPMGSGASGYTCDEHEENELDEVGDGGMLLLEVASQPGQFLSCPAGGVATLVWRDSDSIVPDDCVLRSTRLDASTLAREPDPRTASFPDRVFENQSFEKRQGDWMGRKDGSNSAKLICRDGPNGSGLVKQNEIPDMQDGCGLWQVQTSATTDAHGWQELVAGLR
eukprot:g4606.t1